MEVIANVPEVNCEGLNKSEKANNGSYSSQKKNRIQVSNSKKPLFFYVNLAKKYMRLHEEVELSALGMAIATVVTISEILKNNGLAIEKKILTSTVGMKDENKGKLVKKSKIAILLGKSENFESLLTVATDVVAKITEDNKEKVAERKRVLNPKVTRAFNLALQLGKDHYKNGRVLKPHLIVKAVDSDLALIMETSQPFKITRLQSCHWTNFRFLCTSGSLSLMIDSNNQYLIEMNLRNGDVKMLPSLPIVVQSLVGCFSGTLSEIALLGLKDQHLYLFLSSGEEWQVIEVSAMSPKMVRQILEGPVVNKKTLFWISNGNTVERLTENGEYSKREIKEFASGVATCIGVYNSFVYAVQIRGEHTVIAKVATKPELEYMIVRSVSQNCFCVPAHQCICTGSSDVAGKVYFPDIDYHITGYEPHTQFISSWYPCPGCLHTTSTWVLL